MPRRKVAPEGKFEKDRRTSRPFRIWDASKQQQLMGRWYWYPEKAHDAAAVLCRRDAKLGQTFEVLDKKRAKLVGIYTKVSTGIKIKLERHLREEEKLRKAVDGEEG